MGDKIYKRLLIRELRNIMNKTVVMPGGEVFTCVGKYRHIREVADQETIVKWSGILNA